MLCEQIADLEVVRAFDKPEIFLVEMPKLDFDLCILDIEMPRLNGLQLANLLPDKFIIFTTAYKEYASEAYDLNAIDYVRKPIQKDRLQQAINKVKSRLESVNVGLEKEKNFVSLNTDQGKALLYFDQIAYFRVSEADSRDKIAFFMDKTSLLLKNISFEKLQDLLPEQDFARINKKELIALRIVRGFSFDEIVSQIETEKGKFLSFNLSEVYRNEFLRKIGQGI